MKKLFSTRYSDVAFDAAMFLLRAGFGFLLFLNHGLPKLMKFAERKDTFSDPFGIGHTPSLLLVIFAEVFCALLLVLGLLSRFASFALVALFSVIIFVIQKSDSLKDKQMAILFLLAFFTTLLCGPGRWSVDKLIGK